MHRRDTRSPPYITGETAEQSEIQDCRVSRNLKPFLRERFLPPGLSWLDFANEILPRDMFSGSLYKQL